jgi:secreted PhoX family phosphatase
MFPQGLPELGELGPANPDGVRLPLGFSARIIAVSGEEVPGGGGYVWHDFPDGGTTFASQDGGFLYVSNSEVKDGGGGVGVLALSASGEIVAAYSICQGTSMNCQGGATPWGTFLTCEEVNTGKVFECFPSGGKDAVLRPALGIFRHEGLAYDLDRHQIYMTEDEADGRFYRYTPSSVVGGVADLGSGTLAVAVVADDGRVTWAEVPEPAALDPEPATRYQVPESEPFAGGEGVWWQAGKVYFTTKLDDRVWVYDIEAGTLAVLYDAKVAQSPMLTGVDAIVGMASGELLVAEDQGDMQVVVILPNGDLKALLQLDGQDGSEITGIAFDPSGTRFFFSSQRGNGRGLTYEVVGPFPGASR